MKVSSYLVLVFSSLVLFASCGGGGNKDQANNIANVVNTASGDTYRVVKANTTDERFSVYVNNRTGEFFAINIDLFDQLAVSSMEEFFEQTVADLDYVRDLSVIEETDWEDDDLGGTLVITEYYVRGDFRFSNHKDVTKDLEVLASLEEEESLALVSDSLKAQFSLSASRSDELANMVVRYQKISSIRELTALERDSFALDALGVSYSAVESALKAKSQGETTQYDALLNKAAAVNKTTSEKVGEFLETYL